MENIPLDEISRIGDSTFFYSPKIIFYSWARIKESKKSHTATNNSSTALHQ
jgi:hypothetical protein